MSALPAVRASLGKTVRFVQIRDDAMEPSLRRHTDYVVMLPCEEFRHDGLYVIDQGGLAVTVRRIEGCRDHVRIVPENRRYSAQKIHKADFADICLGLVVGRLLIDDVASLAEAGICTAE